jgi:DNA-binding CsgD family transcriptional regulator
MLEAVATPQPDDIAVITRCVDAFNRRDMSSVVEAIHPEATIVPGPKPNYSPRGVTYHGRAGLETLLRAVFARAPRLRIEAQRFLNLGDRVLVSLSLIEDEERGSRDTAILYSVDGGQIVHVEAFETPAKAEASIKGSVGASVGAPRLTARQREVFSLLAQGLNAWEIADRLAISPDTVRTHIRNGLVKLGAKTRTQAVAIALTAGDIEL